MALLFGLTFCLALSACGQTAEIAAGSIDQDQGSPSGYIGLYRLTGR